ncbi:hypothetical protein ABH546_17780 [Escherichia coli]
MAGEADNVFALTTVYATKAQAMRAAQAKWDKLQRGVAGVLHQPGYRSGRYLHGNTGQSVRL